MTWGTTHLAISAIVAYLDPNLKQKYKNNPVIFFLITLGGITPDLDIIFGIHRTYTHTLFFPLSILLVLYTIDYKNDNQKISYIRSFFWLWLLHILMDLTFGPLPLFYPLDNRYYDIHIGIILNLKGNFILPITLAGFYIQNSFVDPSVGSSVFFINWSATERISYFGSENIKIPIANFVTHLILFLWYFYFVIFPVISQIYNRNKLLNQNKNTDESYNFNKLYKFKRYKFGLVLVLIILLFSSYLAGPASGMNWQYTENSSEQFYILSDALRIVGFRTFTNINNLTINFHVDKSELGYNIFIHLINDTTDYYNDILNIIKMYDNNTYSYNQFYSTYCNYTRRFNQININSSNDFDIQYNITENTKVSFVYGIAKWNITNYFVRSIHINAVWDIDRSTQYRNAIISIYLFSSLILMHIIINVIRLIKFVKGRN